MGAVAWRFKLGAYALSFKPAKPAVRLDASAPNVALPGPTGQALQRHARPRWRIAAQEGRIVPVIARDPAGGYDSDRLVIERVVTVNTTASGGNAELLAITA